MELEASVAAAISWLRGAAAGSQPPNGGGRRPREKESRTRCSLQIFLLCRALALHGEWWCAAADESADGH